VENFLDPQRPVEKYFAIIGWHRKGEYPNMQKNANHRSVSWDR
jgi:hypothetical protein